MRLSAVVVVIVCCVFGQSKSESSQCISNKDCPGDRLCAEFQCINPCLLNLCDNPVDCKVTNHIPVCSCNCEHPVLTDRGPAIKKPEKKFRIFLRELNWFGAMLHCTSLNMTLATIVSQEEQDRVVELIKQSVPENAFGRYWIGGADLHKENDIVWFVTGKPLSYNHFRPYQPNNYVYPDGDDEDCLEIIRGNIWKDYDWNYEWNDGVCKHTNYFVCEYYD